jgi:hypothetical protein
MPAKQSPATLFIAILVPALFLAACGSPDVVAYVALDQEHSEELLRTFAAESGLKVQTRFDTEASKTVGLVSALLEEQARPRCDVFWNNELAQTVCYDPIYGYPWYAYNEVLNTMHSAGWTAGYYNFARSGFSTDDVINAKSNDACGQGYLANGGTTSETVAAGTYTTTQTAVSGWALSSIACDDADSSGNVVAAAVPVGEQMLG